MYRGPSIAAGPRRSRLSATHGTVIEHLRRGRPEPGRRPIFAGISAIPAPRDPSRVLPDATENFSMLAASCLKRSATLLTGCALALLLSAPAHCQIINLSLNVFYYEPSDINSGGHWELVAKSTNSGIAAMDIALAGINLPSVTNVAPRGVVNGSDPAGFASLDQLNGKFTLYQVPAFPTGQEVESAFYGVGTTANGSPSTALFPPGSLTALQDVPWAVGGDPLVEGPSEWDIAARLLSGTFNENTQPGFGAGTAGRVFTSVGTSTTYAPTILATITTDIRTNFDPGSSLPDYNDDGVIDAADYVVWRKGLPQADGTGDSIVDGDDYDEWLEHFAEVIPLPGSAPASGGAVPEPASAILLIFTGIFTFPTRRRRANLPFAA
jgi:hypothetical protein